MALSTSIVIPAYNGARFLKETLASVCAQTCDDWELLVVDDASTDETPAVVQEWSRQDTRIQYFRRSSPSGSACPARNDGFRRSNPDTATLLFLDQDDPLKPDALARLRAVLERNPEAGGAHGLVEYIDADSQVFGRQSADSRYEWRNGRVVTLSPEEPTTFYTLATRCCIRAPGSVLVRRSALEGRLPFPDDKQALDWDGWLALSSRFPLIPLFEITLSYRHSPQGMTRNQEKVRQRILATRRRIAANPAFSQEQREYVLRAAAPDEWALAIEKRNYLTEALRTGRMKEALRQGAYSLRHLERSLRNSIEARRQIVELLDSKQNAQVGGRKVPAENSTVRK